MIKWLNQTLHWCWAVGAFNSTWEILLLFFCFLFSSFLNVIFFFYLQFSSQQNTTKKINKIKMMFYFWVKIKHQHRSKILFFLYNFPPTTKMIFLSTVQKNSWNGNCLSAGHTRNSFVEWRLFYPSRSCVSYPQSFLTLSLFCSILWLTVGQWYSFVRDHIFKQFKSPTFMPFFFTCTVSKKYLDIMCKILRTYSQTSSWCTIIVTNESNVWITCSSSNKFLTSVAHIS